MTSLRQAIDLLVYMSVGLGLVLLPQLYLSVPSWLFYSVVVGWVAYFLVAVAIAFGHKAAYPVALLLSIITLIVSIPQPEHRSFVKAELSLALLTFIMGSIVQAAILILIPAYMWKNRKNRHN